MLKFEHYRMIFVAVGAIGILLCGLPLLGLPSLPAGESFSELYVLGPERMLEGYPFNVEAGESYLVYLGVINHVGSSAYYACVVKLRTQTESLPDAVAGTPSTLEPLYEYRLFLEDGKGWEEPLTFSFSDVSFSDGEALVGSVHLNGVEFEVDKRAVWNQDASGYFYELVVELWRYEAGLGMRFDSRYVHFWLNMTSAT
jgi:hypothetical protein